MMSQCIRFAEHIPADVAMEGAASGVIGADVPDEFPPIAEGPFAQVTIETPLRLVKCCNVST